MVSVRRFALVGVWAVVVGLTGVVAAQDPSNVSRPDVPPLWRAAGNFVLTLLIGGVLLTTGYNYVTRVTERIREEPGTSFLWGLALLVLFVVGGVLVALLLGVVGRLLFVGLVITFVVVAIVGSILAYLALFGLVVESRWVALGLAAVVGSVLAFVPILGPIVGFLVTTVGVGAIARNYRA